ncbi:MAG: carbon-nitrogen hydrolase family protein [Bacteroidales bacterium]|nr:carbon-nitrogen hydrolase family protein [Bacteroidales bacterium]
MEKIRSVSRRNFIRQSSAGLGGGLVGLSISACAPSEPAESRKMARRVSVASIDLKGLWPDRTRESRIKRMLERMENVAGLHPDLVCLPELFDTSWVEEQVVLSEIAEDEITPGPVTGRIAEFAKKNNCYVACPIYTKKAGNFYNSCLLIDRKGNIAGAYNKMHPVKDEIITGTPGKETIGILPGALNQPVIETDFGKVGIQICYDANWQDGWENFKKQGAEIILFTSQFPGGRILNYFAWRYGCYIISATGSDARVIDMSGNDLHSSSTFVRYTWADINLEKLNADTWPTNERLPDLFNKYGSSLGIKVFDNTGVITIESLDSKIKVRDVLNEFKILTVDENVKASEVVQDKYRI